MEFVSHGVPEYILWSNLLLSSSPGCWSPAVSRFRQTLPHCLCSVSNLRRSLLKKSKLLFHWVFWDDCLMLQNLRAHLKQQCSESLQVMVHHNMNGECFCSLQFPLVLECHVLILHLHYPPIITDKHSLIAFSSFLVQFYSCCFIYVYW